MTALRFVTLLAGSIQLGGAAVVGYAAGTASDLQVSDDVKAVGAFVVILALAGVGLMSFARKFLPHQKPAGLGPSSDVLIQALTGNAEWRANVVSALTGIAQTDRATLDRLEALAVKIQDNIDHTRHVLANTVGGVAGHVELTGRTVDAMDSTLKTAAGQIAILHDREVNQPRGGKR